MRRLLTHGTATGRAAGAARLGTASRDATAQAALAFAAAHHGAAARIAGLPVR